MMLSVAKISELLSKLFSESKYKKFKIKKNSLKLFFKLLYNFIYSVFSSLNT